MINEEVKRDWIEALRSGDYKQCRMQQHMVIDGEVNYCAIGVLRKILDYDDGPDQRWLGHDHGFVQLLENLGIDFEIRKNVITRNDHQGLTFEQIADWLEEETDKSDQ